MLRTFDTISAYDLIYEEELCSSKIRINEDCSIFDDMRSVKYECNVERQQHLIIEYSYKSKYRPLQLCVPHSTA
jgi:hypothetical protein